MRHTKRRPDSTSERLKLGTCLNHIGRPKAIHAACRTVRQNAPFRRMGLSPHARLDWQAFIRGVRQAGWLTAARGQPTKLQRLRQRGIRYVTYRESGSVQPILGLVVRMFAALAIAAGLMSPALAQGVVKAQYGDWQMSCDTPPGASFEQCAIIQNVTAEDQPNVGLSVIVLKTADRQARLLRVLAPLGVLLPNGLGLNIDGADIGRVAFVRCLPNGCVAEVVLDDTLIQKLSTGQNAIFVVFKTPEEGIGIPVSLNGFADGFGQLP
jgi:invasion protein IalB